MVSARIKVVAPAKINLCLQVLGRRDDGYHEVRTVLQAIDILDRLELRLDPESDGFSLEMDPEVPGVPAGEGNLCRAAFERFREAAGAAWAGGGWHLVLRKRIPAAAGLGGGSSDAAATLLALNGLMSAPLDGERLALVAAELGSDVPFFLGGGTAFAEGRGERVSPFGDTAPLQIVVAKPPAQLPTRQVYEAWDRRRAEGREKTTGCESQSTWREVLRRGDVAEIERLMGNGLEPVAVELAPAVGLLLEAARERGVRAMVSGSGPTIFALAEGPERAADLAGTWEPMAQEVWVTRTRPVGCEVIS